MVSAKVWILDAIFARSTDIIEGSMAPLIVIGIVTLKVLLLLLVVVDLIGCVCVCLLLIIANLSRGKTASGPSSPNE